MSDSTQLSSFSGQLFRGEAKAKSWTPLVAGHVTVVVVMRGSGWWMVASKKNDKVWEGRIDPGFKHRVKDNFVQWQYKSDAGSPETFGLRVKTVAAAQQFSEAITHAMTNMTQPRAPVSLESEDVSLKVLLPGREVTSITIAKSATVLQILKIICQRRHLDPSSYAIALPPDTAHGQPVLCQHSTSVGGLRSNEIHIVKRPLKQPMPPTTESTDSATSNGVSEHTILIQVELPHDERTVVRVSPALSLRQLLAYICEKRNMEETRYWFDLPATEESLAGKTLEQLKINSFKVISRFPNQHDDSSSATPPTPGKSPSSKRKTFRTKKDKKESKKDKEQHRKEKEEGNRRIAPPPPPPLQRRRTQPDFIKELSVTAEKKATLRHRGQSFDHDTGHSIESHDYDTATPISGDTTPTLSEREEAIKDETDVGVLETSEPIESTNGTLKSTTSKSRLKPRSHPPPAPTKATPTLDTPIEEGSSETKSHKPPPVASKPKKKKKKVKKKAESVGQDEPDLGAPGDEVVPSETLDELVIEASSESSEVVEVKVRADEDLITEALKKQAQDGSKFGKYPSARVKRKTKLTHSDDLDGDDDGRAREKTRHGSLERDKVNRPQTVAQGSPLILAYPHHPLTADDKVPPPSGKTEHSSSPANLTTATGANLKRKPRGPAPPPPISKANTLARTKHIAQEAMKPRSSSLDDNSQSQTSEQSLQSLLTGIKPPSKPRSVSEVTQPPRTYDIYATRQRPTRKAPSRPAPATPKKRTAEKPSKPVVEEEPETKIDEKQNEELKLSEEREASDEIDGEENGPVAVPPPSAPKTVSPTPQQRKISPKVSPSSSKRSNTATAICQETEDGGKVLIVKPSPQSKRRNAPAIVFKLPPPPPTPAKVPLSNTTKSSLEGESSTSSFEDAGSQDERAVKQDGGTTKGPPPPVPPKTPSPKPRRKATTTPDKQDLSSTSGSSLDSTREEVGVVSPSSKTGDGDMTILSNEFTNFDDLLEDSAHVEGGIVSTDFSNLEPIDDSIGMGHNESTGSDSGTKIEDEIERSETSDSTDSSLNEKVSSYDIMPSDNVPLGDPEEVRPHTTADITQSPGHQRRAPPSPPVSNTVIMTLNMNTNNSNNNNNDVIMEVPPPVGFDTPPSECSDEGEGGVETGGIILVSMKKMHSGVELSSLPESTEQVEPVSPVSPDSGVAVLPEQVEPVPEDGWTSNTSLEEEKKATNEDEDSLAITTKPSIGTQLSELDSIVSTLHDMIDDTTSTPPPERIPTPPPDDGESTPPPDRVPTPPPFSLVTDHYTSSPISPKKSIKSDVIIPPPVARKPVRKPSDRVSQTDDDELLHVLKNRQEKLKAQSESETAPSTTTTEDSTPSSLKPHPQLPNADSIGGGGGEAVQVQLQFLQQQVLQQQMMQLQQQFQQLQSMATQQNVQMPMMMPGMNMPFMPQATPTVGMPNPSLFGAHQAPGPAPMMMPQHTGLTGMTGMPGVVQPGLQLPPSSMNPGMLHQQGVMPPAQMYYQQGLIQQGSTQLPYQQGVAQTVSTQALPPHLQATSQAMQMQYNLQQQQQSGVPLHHQQGVSPNPEETTSGEGGVAKTNDTAPPTVNLDTFPGQIPATDNEDDVNIAEELEQVTTTPISAARRLRNRKRSEDIRSYVLGPLEDQFDALMEEVRDTDADDHLRKTPEMELEREPASSYTGMAAALVEALKQRRLQVTEEGGALEELDESNASEWLSP